MHPLILTTKTHKKAIRAVVSFICFQRTVKYSLWVRVLHTPQPHLCHNSTTGIELETPLPTDLGSNLGAPLQPASQQILGVCLVAGLSAVELLDRERVVGDAHALGVDKAVLLRHV